MFPLGALREAGKRPTLRTSLVDLFLTYGGIFSNYTRFHSTQCLRYCLACRSVVWQLILEGRRGVEEY